MNWVPLAESGIGYTPSLPAGVSISGSVVTGIRSSAPELQAWEIALAKPVKIRVTIQEFDSAGYAESGTFVFGYPSGLFESIDNAGGANEWSPNPVASGGDAVSVMYGPGDQSDYPNDSYTMLVEVWMAETCQEIGRVTRSYVSAHNRYRVHVGQVRRQERRCVVADFNGAIPASRSIVAVRWDCMNPWVAKMSAPAINGREVQVTADFQFGGFAALRASVTLDNGEIYNQAFEFTVRDAPCFIENAPTNAGPFTLMAAVD